MLGLVPPYKALISVESKALLNTATSSILPFKVFQVLKTPCPIIKSDVAVFKLEALTKLRMK